MVLHDSARRLHPIRNRNGLLAKGLEQANSHHFRYDLMWIMSIFGRAKYFTECQRRQHAQNDDPRLGSSWPFYPNWTYPSFALNG